MNSLVRLIITATLIAVISACGFHLRGAKDINTGDNPLYIQHENAPGFANRLRQQLQFANAKLAASAKQAYYIVHLYDEGFDRDILSLDASAGRAKEYILTLSVSMRITDNEGEEIMEERLIEVSREFVFDEDEILGQKNESDILKKDMLRQGVSQVMRNIRAATAMQQKKSPEK